MTYYSKHTLFDKQVRYIKSQSRYTLYSGAVRGGKTVAMCYRALMKATPGVKQLIACHTYKMLSRVILPVLREVIFALPVSCWAYNKSDQIIEIKHDGKEDSIIYLSHLQDPFSIQGMTLDHYHLDEATAGVSKDTFEMLNSRLSQAGATASIATNPGALSHWIYTFFNEFDPIKNMAENKTVIVAKTRDNPHLPQDYLHDLMQRPKTWRDRFIEGKWGLLEGVIYDDFDRSHHMIEFDHSSNWKFGIAIDYGFVNPFVCLVVAQDHDGRYYVVDEYYKTRTLINDHAAHIKKWFLNQYPIKLMISDNNEPASRVQLEDSLKINAEFAVAFKRVIPGINAVKDNFVIQGDGLPRLFIHPRCKNLIRELESYRWKEASDGTILEEPKKENDHGCDALRYYIRTMES